jgi:hypothetical protein
MPAPCEIFTEIDAISLLTGANAELIAAGGVSGAEGGVWLGISGTSEVEQNTEILLKSLLGETAFII